MTWDSERSKSGKQPWNWIEIELDRCTNVYGDAFESPTGLCAAQVGVTGAVKCFNSWQTCQDQDNFVRAPFWVRFAEPVANIPRSFDFDIVSPSEDGLAVFLPLLRDIRHSPTLPDPGQSMGLRVSLTVTLGDAPHHDRGIDKYVDERTYDPMRQGTFLRKLKARWPHYIGRRLRWYQGYISESPSAADFRMREYVMERFEGPDAAGRVKIIAKDVLKLVDSDRAQAPAPSKGTLVLDMADTDTPSAFDVATTDLTEYDLAGSPSVGYVRIGGEIFTYTGTALSSPDEGNVTLTGVTRAAPSPYTSPLEDHDAGDLVQKCLYFSGTVPAIINELLTTYGGISSAYIPLSDWTTEASTWTSGDNIQRLVADPEGVQDLINEIIEQTLTWGLWYDEVASQIKFRTIRPADTTDTVATINETANIVADSLKLIDEPDRLVNEVQALYGQIDPTKPRDELENYRAGVAVVDSDSQSANESGQRRIRRIFCRWRTVAAGAFVTAWAQRTLSARAKNLRLIEFDVDRKDEDIDTGNFADITSRYVIDASGAQLQTRFQVLRTDSTGERVKMRAREDFFKVSRFARWAPDVSPSVLFESATDAEKLNYGFWADAGGKNGNSFSPQAPEDGDIWL